MEAQIQNHISRVSNICKAIDEQLGKIRTEDILNGQFAAKAGQKDIDEVESFKAMGLTAEDYAAVVYTLKQIRNLVETTNITAWVKVANL